MKKILFMTMMAVFAGVVFAAHGKVQTKTTAEQAMLKLEAGNKRYYAGQPLNKYRGKKRRVLAARGQRPFAIILTCSDSRLPPEIIFDQGIGDLFVIRTAGHVIDDTVLGSIEYAVEHFGVKLIVVLGHERCGAVTAAVTGGEAPGHIKGIVEKLETAAARASVEPGDLLDNAIMINVTSAVKQLCNSMPVLKPKVMLGQLKIAGAYYDLETGVVQGVME